MTSRGFATRFTLAVVATLALASLSASPARAEQDHSHGGAAQNNALAKLVRQITEPYKDVSAAEGAGYALAFGCVSGPDCGGDGTPLRQHAARAGRPDRSGASRDYPLRARWERRGATGWRGLPGVRGRLGQDALVCARTHGTEVPAIRGAEPVRAAAVLHASRVGLEGKPDGHVRELAREYFVRRVLRSDASSRHVRARRSTFYDFRGVSWIAHRSTRQGGHAG